MTNKTKIIIGISVGVGLIAIHALVKAKLTQPREKVGRSNYGWKVYNLIKNGKFVRNLEVQNIKK